MKRTKFTNKVYKLLLEKYKGIGIVEMQTRDREWEIIQISIAVTCEYIKSMCFKMPTDKELVRYEIGDFRTSQRINSFPIEGTTPEFAFIYIESQLGEPAYRLQTLEKEDE